MSVTLLFTDIEGSTRLVQQLGEGYAAALERHRIAVRAALAAHAGEEIDCRGDEFSIAFRDPGEALAAAEAIQQSPVDGIRVRIGIHTGEPIRIDGGYVGLDVHRAARICAAGHGGQVLVSQATASLVPASRSVTSASTTCAVSTSPSGSTSSVRRTSRRSAPTPPRSGSAPAPGSSSPTTPSCCARESRACSRTPASRSSARRATPTS